MRRLRAHDGVLRLGLPPVPAQDNASKLLLALMESRHDSENAERILISLRPQELVRTGWQQERVAWVVQVLVSTPGVGMTNSKCCCSLPS